MTEQTVGQVLEQDHHVIDEYFAVFARSLEAAANETGALDALALETGVRALRHHIYVEEEFHFPPLRAGGLMGPLMVMLREHGELWGLLDRLQLEVADDAPTTDVFQTWGHVSTLLDAHNMKEEQIIYPGGDQILDAATSADVVEALHDGQLPDGWVCQMATSPTTSKVEK